MTRLLTTILFFCLLQLAFSQDIVVLRNGSRLEGKIVDIGKKQVIFQQLGPRDNGFGGSGEMATGVYLSSSEVSGFVAWGHDFDTGIAGSAAKDFGFRCRCVRK